LIWSRPDLSKTRYSLTQKKPKARIFAYNGRFLHRRRIHHDLLKLQPRNDLKRVVKLAFSTNESACTVMLVHK